MHLDLGMNLTDPAGSGDQKQSDMTNTNNADFRRQEIKCQRKNGKWGFYYEDGRYYHFAHPMTKQKIIEHFAHYDNVFGKETKVIFV